MITATTKKHTNPADSDPATNAADCIFVVDSPCPCTNDSGNSVLTAADNMVGAFTGKSVVDESERAGILMGTADGVIDGDRVGTCEGKSVVGESVSVGILVGISDGAIDGDRVGACEGKPVVGESVSVGVLVGTSVGVQVVSTQSHKNTPA